MLGLRICTTEPIILDLVHPQNYSAKEYTSNLFAPKNIHPKSLDLSPEAPETLRPGTRIEAWTHTSPRAKRANAASVDSRQAVPDFLSFSCWLVVKEDLLEVVNPTSKGTASWNPCLGKKS